MGHIPDVRDDSVGRIDANRARRGGFRRKRVGLPAELIGNRLACLQVHVSLRFAADSHLDVARRFEAFCADRTILACISREVRVGEPLRKRIAMQLDRSEIAPFRCVERSRRARRFVARLVFRAVGIYDGTLLHGDAASERVRARQRELSGAALDYPALADERVLDCDVEPRSIDDQPARRDFARKIVCITEKTRIGFRGHDRSAVEHDAALAVRIARAPVELHTEVRQCQRSAVELQRARRAVVSAAEREAAAVEIRHRERTAVHRHLADAVLTDVEILHRIYGRAFVYDHFRSAAARVTHAAFRRQRQRASVHHKAGYRVLRIPHAQILCLIRAALDLEMRRRFADVLADAKLAGRCEAVRRLGRAPHERRLASRIDPDVRSQGRNRVEHDETVVQIAEVCRARVGVRHARSRRIAAGFGPIRGMRPRRVVRCAAPVPAGRRRIREEYSKDCRHRHYVLHVEPPFVCLQPYSIICPRLCGITL